MKEALLRRFFSLRTEVEGVQGLEKGSSHMTHISLKDALALNEEVVLTEERWLLLKYEPMAEEG